MPEVSNNNKTELSSSRRNDSTSGVGGSTSNSSFEFEPPLACIKRLLKNSLPSSTNVGKDASSAFARACGIFAIYVTTCANDFARENRRTTVTANDILASIKELDFDEFTPELTAFLKKHRSDEQSKKDAKKAEIKNINTTPPPSPPSKRIKLDNISPSKTTKAIPNKEDDSVDAVEEEDDEEEKDLSDNDDEEEE